MFTDNNMHKRTYEMFIKTCPITSSFFNTKKGYRTEFRNQIKEILNKSHPHAFKKINKYDKFYFFLKFYFKNKKTKVDLDNLAKPILDSFTGIIYKDDTQIFKLYLEKNYNSFIEGIAISFKRL